MPPKAAAKAPKKKNGYVLAEKFDSGFVLKDIFKNQWTIGAPIGQGGFGLIYLAMKGSDVNVNTNNADHVIKIEPKDNGPLFCETHFYTNCAKEDDINTFMKSYKLKHLAIPRYIASGLCVYNDKDYRFLVMQRYTKDVQTILTENDHCLAESCVLYLTRQIMYTLEYIHNKGYAHGDIKGANLMIRNDKEVFLLDYGLAQRFAREGVHIPYKEKPERRHNGTIEYTSRDAHNGAPPSRRADLEILGFCIIHWLSGTLPWMNSLTKPEEVQKLKVKSMDNVKDFIQTVFLKSNNHVSNQVKSFLEYFLNCVNKLKYDEEPNYFQIQTKISDTLKACGYSNDDNFQLLSRPKSSKTPVPKRKTEKQKASAACAKSYDSIDYNDDEEEEEEEEEEDIELKNTRNKRSKNNGVEEKIVRKIDNDVCMPKYADSKKVNGSLGLAQAKPVDKRKPEAKIVVSKELSDNEDDSIEDRVVRSRRPLRADGSNHIIPGAVGLNGNGKLHTPGIRSSPRTPKPIIQTSVAASGQKLRNGIKYEDEVLTDDDSVVNGKTPAKPTPARKQIIKEEGINGFASPAYNRVKSTRSDEATTRSPLALDNLDDDGQVRLVRKRRNVPKSTCSTQTDMSCLNKHNK